MRIILLCLLVVGFTSCKTMSHLMTEPTVLENVSAVKEVMNSSAFKAITTLTKLGGDDPTAGLPKEVGMVLGALKNLGLGNEMDKTLNSIGMASRLVTAETKVLMQESIQELDIKDAAAIILGGESAATSVLKQAMYGSVKKRYSARLDQELNKTDATKYWPMAASAFNLFAKNKVEGKLSDFMAERAVDGLFLTMGKEEKKVRTDYKSLGSQTVTKVFDYYTKKKKQG